jgi:uncharacterized protein YjbI with pentapeptide repeats
VVLIGAPTQQRSDNMETNLPPIPAHLPAWQAPHLAWLASHGRPTRYAVPDGTEPMQADLYGANLRWADLSGADLYGAVLCGANLRWAVLCGADLSGADLSGADLTGADLSGADLRGAILRGAILRGAILRHARGIASIGPVGRHGRIIYAVAHDDGPRIQAGCWWGGVDDTIARIEADYSNDPAARDRYIAAVRLTAALVSP